MPDFVDTTADLLMIIESQPGIHFRGIASESGRQIGVVSYHLDKLQKDNKIIGVQHRKNKLFFSSNWSSKITEVVVLIDYLRKTLPRAILLLLSNFPQYQKSSIKELAKILGKTPSSIHWHIKRLIEDQIITPIRRGRTVTLKLNIDCSVINRLGDEIYPGRWGRYLDRIDALFDL